MNTAKGSVPSVTGAQCTKLIYRFDDVMNQLLASPSANVAIRLGPGTFQTRGHDEARAYPGWQYKAGQRLIITGSGIDVTWLKVMYASFVDGHVSAINAGYNDYLNYFEASDFTVDCNLPGQLHLHGQYVSSDGHNVSNLPQVACGALRAVGQHARIRRIRAINFGTECWFSPCAGSGPWVQADLENGLFAGGNGSWSANTGRSSAYVTALLKNNGTTTYAIKDGNAQSGGLSTRYNGALPNLGGYKPMHKEGAIVLGTGGDNSDGSVGSIPLAEFRCNSSFLSPPEITGWLNFQTFSSTRSFRITPLSSKRPQKPK